MTQRFIHLCPACGSSRILTRDCAKRCGAAIGATIGALCGFVTVIRSVQTSLPADPAEIVLGGFTGVLAGATAGCAAGRALGHQLDVNILKNYRCNACGFCFT